jgi:hypothetical protein
MYIYQQLSSVADLLFYPFLLALVAAFFIGLTLVYSLLHPKKNRRRHARRLMNDLLKHLRHLVSALLRVVIVRKRR